MSAIMYLVTLLKKDEYKNALGSEAARMQAVSKASSPAPSSLSQPRSYSVGISEHYTLQSFSESSYLTPQAVCMSAWRLCIREL